LPCNDHCVRCAGAGGAGSGLAGPGGGLLADCRRAAGVCPFEAGAAAEPPGAAVSAGSAFMMLTGGTDDAEGKLNFDANGPPGTGIADVVAGAEGAASASVAAVAAFSDRQLAEWLAT
jgi:hypothetical protein